MSTVTLTLLLVRHGRAESAPGRPDAERHLTPEGQAELRACCVGVRGLGVHLDVVMTSPLVRARETASILASALGNGVVVRSEDVLAPGATLDPLVGLLRGFNAGATVAAVGHAPDMVGILADIVLPGGRRTAPFPPAGMACIEFAGSIAAGAGQLKWTYTPAELCGLGVPSR